MKKTFNFGKINYNGTGKRYPVTVNVELKKRGGDDVFRMENGQRVYTGEKTPVYYEFTASAMIGKRCGGQCLDTIARHIGELDDPATFRKIHAYWKKYHLNGMHAGTPEQENAIDEWKKAGNKYDYSAVCEMLKERGLYEIPYTGLSVGRKYTGELYKYGHAWLVQEIPADVLQDMIQLLSNRDMIETAA
jgi:hypothetical protein